MRWQRHLPSFFLLAIVALALIGCGSQPYPPNLAYPSRSDLIVVKPPEGNPDGPAEAGKIDEFLAQTNARGGKAYDPANIPEAKRDQLQAALQHAFGSPSAPLVRADDGESHALAERMQLQPDRLAEASKLYRRHCLQCHGLTGDGRGPTGLWVYPLPRDYRQGVFKYVSSNGSAARKPARADLQRTLINGIERTSMPKFHLLSDHERDLLISYVIHLSLRGEVEYRVMRSLLSETDEPPDENLQRELAAVLSNSLRQWAQAEDDRISPTTFPTPANADDRITGEHLESVRRGYQLFTQQTTGCITCHEDFGRQVKHRYDIWGTVVKPLDLIEGAYRGGKTPADLFNRIRGGIGPSGMPAAALLSEQQIWDLVHFVMALPFPKALPTDIRGRVYPSERGN
jgi:mono/diheme cytochrome c family protein